MAILGRLYLRLDAKQYPLQTPLKDTWDVVERLRELSSTLTVDPFDMSEIRITALDFESLYTRFIWEDVSEAFKYWSCLAQSLCNTYTNLFSDLELVFFEWFHAPIPREEFDVMMGKLPFCFLQWQPDLMWGEVFLHICFSNSIFITVGVGIFRQKFGSESPSSGL